MVSTSQGWQAGQRARLGRALALGPYAGRHSGFQDDKCVIPGYLCK
jgi:hypothetical protein